MRTVEQKPKRVWNHLKKVASDLKKIPLKRKLAECPRVLIVGEIYTGPHRPCSRFTAGYAPDNGQYPKVLC